VESLEIRKRCLGIAGLGGSLGLAVGYLLAEVALRWSGAAFLYVTSHFIVMPALSILLLGAIAFRGVRERHPVILVALLASSIVPVAILWITAKADPEILSFLGPFRTP